MTFDEGDLCVLLLHLVQHVRGFLVIAIIDNGWSKTEVDFYPFTWKELENLLTDKAKEKLFNI